MSLKSKFIEKAKQMLGEELIKSLMEELKSQLDKTDRSNFSKNEIVTTCEDMLQIFYNASKNFQEQAEKAFAEVINGE